jgi:cytochrome c oxidase subunit 4
VSTHVLPTATYFRVFTILITLTVVTVIIAFIDLGAVNPMVALGIAATKATLVVTYFMHLKFSNRVTRAFFLTGVAGVILLFSISLDDELTRTSTTYLPARPIAVEDRVPVMGLDGAAPGAEHLEDAVEPGTAEPGVPGPAR